MQKSKPTHKSQAHNHLILVYNQTFSSLIRSRLALMVLAVLVEIVPVNDKRVDMPRLAFIRSGHPGVPCTMVVNRVLESLVWLAQRDGDVLPRVVAQSAAGVLVAFIGRVDVLGIGGFFCTISLCLSSLSPSHISSRFLIQNIPSVCLETSLPLMETCWVTLLPSISMEKSTSEC